MIAIVAIEQPPGQQIRTIVWVFAGECTEFHVIDVTGRVVGHRRRVKRPVDTRLGRRGTVYNDVAFREHPEGEPF